MKRQKSQNHSGLIWITGYSGAGKTTVARITCERLREAGLPIVLLDGDDLRSILGERFGYTLDERQKLAGIYSRLCRRISNSGVTVVIATVAMFESIRVENRASNETYLEIYLDVPLSVREARDPKGLYKAALARPSSNLDFNTGLQEPVNPDLTIKNHGDISPETAASLIEIAYFELRERINTNRANSVDGDHRESMNFDRIEYWDSFYKSRKAPISPSSFAIFCNENYLDENIHILEFGSGNGRDSFYFAKNHRVTAIDESSVVIEANRARAQQEGAFGVTFLHGEFGREIAELPAVVDAIYGRFVIHAMPVDAETRVLHESWRLLKDGGRLFLEFRTTRDPLMAIGTQLGKTERITDHYRRFIVFDEFCLKLINIGFDLEFSVEKQGLAPQGNDDPIVGRIVARKPM